MDFLTLCQETARESGVIAGLPSFTTTADQSGRVRQLVGWVRDAWIDIQNERSDWLWMRKRFEANLFDGNAVYLPASIGLLRVAEWDRGTSRFNPMSLYDPDTGKSDEGEIRFIPWETWIEQYDRGVHDEDRPTVWSVSPANELLFGPTPNKTYVVRGFYRQTPQELTADSDIPEMPSQYHRVIIAEAIALMSRSDEVIETMTTYKGQYDRLRSALVNAQTPAVGKPSYALA